MLDLKDIKIGIVTVTYNAELHIKDFINSVNKQKKVNYSIYCIDNNSKDKTLNIIEKFKNDRWVVLNNKSNYGVAKGNNQGIRKSILDGNDYTLLLNNDTTFPQNFFYGLTNFALKKSKEIVVPEIFFYDYPEQLWCNGGYFSTLRGYTGVHYDRNLTKEYSKDRESCEYAPTCAMLIKNSVFSRIGLMDEYYFAYWDDTDFCMRLKKSGLKIFIDHSSYLYHKVGLSTGGPRSKFTVYITSRNRLYFISKFYGIYTLIAWLPIFIGLYIYKFLIISFSPMNFLIALEGSWHYFNKFRKQGYC